MRRNRFQRLSGKHSLSLSFLPVQCVQSSQGSVYIRAIMALCEGIGLAGPRVGLVPILFHTFLEYLTQILDLLVIKQDAIVCTVA